MIDHDSEMDECAAATTAVIAAAIAAIAAAAQANYSQTAGEQARTHLRVHVGDLAPEFLPRLLVSFLWPLVSLLLQIFPVILLQ